MLYFNFIENAFIYLFNYQYIENPHKDVKMNLKLMARKQKVDDYVKR